MNFLRALPCLVLTFALQAQAVTGDVLVQAGGELTFDGCTYRLEPASVASLPARPGLPALLRITGRLVPTDPAQSFDFELSILKQDSRIYMLRLLRKGPSGYPDSWTATGKTRARLTGLEDHSGGRVEIACSGPLNGVVDKHPKATTWKGSLWVILP